MASRIIGVVCGVILIACAVGVGYDKGCFDTRRDAYRQGQIDAANGHQHYRLATTPDGEQRWESDAK